MIEENRPDLEALILAEVDRAVAPYVGVAPPVVLRKMRSLSERYWRENPVAVRALRLKGQQQQVRSGTEALLPDGEETRNVGGKGEV